MTVVANICSCSATLNDIDLSNVDLQRFRFFKYPHQPVPEQPIGLPPPPPIPARLLRPGQRVFVIRTIRRPLVEAVEQHTVGALAKVRAIFGYWGAVLFGNLPGLEPEIPVSFHPEAAYRQRVQYERKFGYRGARLIEQLGRAGGGGGRR